jgi:hypothetical protein
MCLQIAERAAGRQVAGRMRDFGHKVSQSLKKKTPTKGPNDGQMSIILLSSPNQYVQLTIRKSANENQ